MEELQLIVQAITGLGSAGKEAFIYYMIGAYVFPYAVGTMALILLFVVLKKIIYGIQTNGGFGSRISRAYYGVGVTDISCQQERDLINAVIQLRKELDN